MRQRRVAGPRLFDRAVDQDCSTSIAGPTESSSRKMEPSVVRSREMTLSLPPFTRAVIWLLAANTAMFLLLELFSVALAGRRTLGVRLPQPQPQQVVSTAGSGKW